MALSGGQGDELGGQSGRDPGARYPGHYSLAASHRGEGKSIRQGLAHDNEIGPDTIAFACAPDREPADGLDLIHDE